MPLCVNAASWKFFNITLWSNILSKLNSVQSFIFVLFLPSFNRYIKRFIFVWQLSLCAFMCLCIHCIINCHFYFNIIEIICFSALMSFPEGIYGHIKKLVVYFSGYFVKTILFFWQIGLNEKFILKTSVFFQSNIAYILKIL